MRSYIKEKYPSIQGFGCSAHGLNLIIKDIIQIPNIQKLVQNSQSIVKEITDSNIKTSIFDEISNGTVKRLKLKTSTRYEYLLLCIVTILVFFCFSWYSTTNMLQSILDAKEILGQMAFNDSVTQVKDILLEKNEDFWQPLSQLIALLKPISKAIGILESDDSKISEIPQVLNDLFTEMTIVSNEFFNSIEYEVNSRNGTIQRRLTCNSQ